VRALLEQHEIEYFETFAGNWGISLPALWLKHKEQYSQARQILDEYQAKRGEKMRAEYEEQRALGQARTHVAQFYGQSTAIHCLLRHDRYCALFLVELFPRLHLRTVLK
jgi:hypothetical protein